MSVGKFVKSACFRPACRRRPEPSRFDLLKTRSQKLKELGERGDINSISELVAAYNREPDNSDRKRHLLLWLEHCVKWVCENSVGYLSNDVMVEYMCLVNTSSSSIGGKNLLKRFFSSLCNKMCQNQYGEQKQIIQAVTCVLQKIEIEVFESETADLFQLVADLFEKLKSIPLYTKRTFPSQSPILAAVHQIFLILRHLAPGELNTKKNSRLYWQFKNTLSVIETESDYYPLLYQVRITQQCLEQLAPDVYGMEVFQRLFSGVTGAIHLYRGLRSFLIADLDIKSFEEAYKRLTESCSRKRSPQQQWLHIIRKLSITGLLCIKEPKEYEKFHEVYMEALDTQKTCQDDENQRALRFGIISELRSLAVEGTDVELREKVTNELVLVTTNYFIRGKWSHDEVVFKALLDALLAVYEKDRNPSVKKLMINRLANLSRPKRTVVNDWLAGQSMDEKLKKHEDNPNRVDESRLFRDVQNGLGMVCLTEKQRDDRIALLKERYHENDYAKADSVLDDEPQRHVSCCHHALVLKKSTDSVPNDWRDADTDSSSANQPLRKIGMQSIELSSLFDAGHCELGDKTRGVRKVSIVGGPGSGKTTLSRKLALDWANGNWGSEFRLVYVIPIKELNSAQCHCGSYAARSLAAAVARVCFPDSPPATHEPLLTQITQDLSHEETLLVLDGLDEADGVGKKMIGSARKCNCNMILLRRHPTLEEEKEEVNFEVECLGLNSNQLREFVVDELAKEDGEMLLQWIRSNPVWRTIAHVPMVAHILCLLWKERKISTSDEGTWSRRFELCNHLSTLMLSSHLKRTGIEDIDRRHVFKELGRVAFGALKCEGKLISHTLLENKIKRGHLTKILKRCGFLQLQPTKNKYQFPHEELLEFFAGKCVARCMYKSNDATMSKVEAFISDSGFFADCRGVCWFALQEICQRNDAAGLLKMIAAVDDDSVDVIGFQKLLLKLEIIETALAAGTKSMQSQVAQSPEVKDIIASCAALLKCWIRDKDLIDLLTDKLGKMEKVIRAFPELLNPSIEELQRHSSVCFDALYVLAKLGRQSTEVLSVIVNLLSEGIQSRDVRMQCDAIGSIPSIVAAAPELRDRMIHILLRGCSDTDSFVRSESAHHLPTLVTKAPETAKKALEAVLHDDRVDSTSELNSIIERIAKTVPHVSVCCLEEVCEDYPDKKTKTRAAAMALVSPVLSAFPENAELAFRLLNLGCFDTDHPEVRRAAVHQIARLKHLETWPKETAWQLLIQACNDDDATVSKIAVEGMLEFAQDSPEHAKEFLALFLRKRGDQSGFSSSSATRGVVGLLQNVPGLTDAALEILSIYPLPEDESLCVAALGQLRHAVSAKNWEEQLQLFEKGCEHEFHHVRSEALKCASVIAENAPFFKTDLLKILAVAAEDPENNVRQAAVSQIGRVFRDRMNSTVALELVEPLCEDEDENVYTTAFHQLPELVMSNPTLVERVFDLVKAGCSKRSWRCRCAAVGQISAIVAAKPRKSARALSLVSDRVKDPSWMVRAKAFDQIPQILIASPDCFTRARSLLTLAQMPGEWPEIRHELSANLQELARVLPREAALISEDLHVKSQEDWSSFVCDITDQEDKCESDAVTDCARSLSEASEGDSLKSSPSRSRNVGTSAWFEEKPRRASLRNSCFADLVDKPWDDEEHASCLHMITLKVLRATISSAAGNSGQRLLKLRASFSEEDGDEIERPVKDIRCLLVRVRQYLNDKYEGFSLILP